MRIVLSAILLILAGGLPSAGVAKHAAPTLPAPMRESGVTLTIIIGDGALLLRV